MHVRSLGFQTDLALLTATGSTVEDRGTHLVIRTPANPSYFWGNFLLLHRAPVLGGEREVVGAFHTEFPDAEHVSIGIDDPVLSEESRSAFEEAGMSIEVSTVLTATALTAPREPGLDCEVRPLVSEEDWAGRTALSQALAPEVSAATFLPFAQGRNEQERTLVAASRGERYGAFVDGRLVATAAVFLTGEGTARYQSVETHSDHRRQGLAGSVIHAAGQHVMDRLGASDLVIVAETDGEAIGVYRAAGFADAEQQLTLERRSGEWAED